MPDDAQEVLKVPEGMKAPSMDFAKHVAGQTKMVTRLAMGALGVDVVLESADITLMRNEITQVPWLIRYSRRMKRTIRNNILFALALKIAVLGLAVVGHAYLWLAVIADTGATLLVVLNALRLLGSIDRD